MDGLGKVRTGDPLQIPAKAYNAFVDAALDHQQRRLSTTADALREKGSANVVLVKNESGSARVRFDVLGVTGPIIARADSVSTFQNRIALRGVTPTSAHAGRFVVLLDALAANAIGRAFIAGACLTRVRMLDESHTVADVDDGQAGQLASSDTGAASLVWVEPVEERDDPAIAWTVIRFSDGGNTASSGDGSDSTLILALLKSVQRFSENYPDLPAYHWKEAQIDPDGIPQERADGQGSKQIPSCDALTVSSEDASYSTLVTPALNENLANASIDTSTGQTRLSFLIQGTADIAHTVTKYRIQVGIGNSPPAARNTYGDSGDLDPGSAPTYQVSGVPLASDVYLRITTTTSDAGVQANIYICQFGLNGDAEPQVNVTDADINHADGAILQSPISGDYGGTIANGLTNLALAWSAVTGATEYDVYVGSGNPADPNAPTGWDLYWAGGLGDVQSNTATNLPADGTPFWVSIYWKIGTTWYWNRWKVTVTPEPDRRALAVEDINRIQTQSQGGLAGHVEIPDGSEDDETTLDPTILVRLRKTLDTSGNDRFVFEHVEQEFHGVIIAESAPAAADDYTDERYWVQFSKVANTGAADEAVTLADATDALAKVATVTNYAEAVRGTHNLPVGTPVIVRTTRGGDKPWITRYTMNIGGGGGLTQIVVTGHGTPYVSSPPDPPGAEVGRIYSHIGRALQGSPPFGVEYGLEDIEFCALQRHGWFHPGAIVGIFQLGGVWVADCRQFFGIVTKAAPVGTSVPRGTVEVEPFDGNPGLAYSDPASLIRHPNSKLYRACTFPGTELQVGEPVLCVYVGSGGVAPDNHDADWLATNMPNLFGDPNAADYANAEPPEASLCVVIDPDLPAPPPTDDVITEDEATVSEVAP